MSFNEEYFSSHTYKDVSFARFSQYWWSNRFYAILARRFGQRGGRLLEIGSGLGHLVGQLQDDFTGIASDVNFWALGKSRSVSKDCAHVNSSGGELPFLNEVFNVVIAKHVVEHLKDPEGAIREMGRVTGIGGILILSTPNLSSLLKPLKGDRWIGYLDPTHISLKSPQEWLASIRNSGFIILRIFSDGFWDVPYIRFIPKWIQKVFFGLLGGIQALSGLVFLPMRWGESIIVIARKSFLEKGT